MNAVNQTDGAKEEGPMVVESGHGNILGSAESHETGSESPKPESVKQQSIFGQGFEAGRKATMREVRLRDDRVRNRDHLSKIRQARIELDQVQPSRERANAITKLDEAIMWLEQHRLVEA